MILCRKRIQRLNNFAEDKRIINEYEKQRLAEIERYFSYYCRFCTIEYLREVTIIYFRRKKENDLRLSRSTEGPAHHVVNLFCHFYAEKYERVVTISSLLNSYLSFFIHLNFILLNAYSTSSY